MRPVPKAHSIFKPTVQVMIDKAQVSSPLEKERANPKQFQK
jgi:hypothetical protein